MLRVYFKDLTIAEQEVLTIALYSRADSWLGWGEARESDNVLRSLVRIFQISMRGLKATAQSIFGDKDGPSSKSTPLSIAPSVILVLAAALLAAASPKSFGQAPVAAAPNSTSPANSANPAISAVLPGQYRESFTLAEAGSPQIEFHNIDSTRKASIFTPPQTHVVRAAKIHVHYAFSPGLLPQLSHLKLSINGTLFATIQPAPGQSGGSDSRTSESEFQIPPELLVHQNALTIEFIGHYTTDCEDPTNTTLWARVLRNTYLEITGDLLPLADDLKQLPAPFVDPAVVQPVSVPVVLTAQPSFKSIQAAGIVTSYLGFVSENRPVRFPVQIGAIPSGNVIVVAENPASLPAALNLAAVTSPTVAMRTNPNDPYGKVLIVTGANAAMTLSSPLKRSSPQRHAQRNGVLSIASLASATSACAGRMLRAGRTPTRPFRCGTTPALNNFKVMEPRLSMFISVSRPTSTTARRGIPTVPTPLCASPIATTP